MLLRQAGQSRWRLPGQVQRVEEGRRHTFSPGTAWLTNRNAINRAVTDSSAASAGSMDASDATVGCARGRDRASSAPASAATRAFLCGSVLPEEKGRADALLTTGSPLRGPSGPADIAPTWDLSAAGVPRPPWTAQKLRLLWARRPGRCEVAALLAGGVGATWAPSRALRRGDGVSAPGSAALSKALADFKGAGRRSCCRGRTLPPPSLRNAPGGERRRPAGCCAEVRSAADSRGLGATTPTDRRPLLLRACVFCIPGMRGLDSSPRE